MYREFNSETYYHVYNRGVDKRKIFLHKNDFQKFCDNLIELNNNLTRDQRNLRKRKKLIIPESDSGMIFPLVSIIAYNILPNHFHLIIKPFIEKGISTFMHKIGTSYTNYFNKKYQRSGVLFQGKFKSKPIKSNSHLLWLSAYINLNHNIHQKKTTPQPANAWPWSSYQEYVAEKPNPLCTKDIILGQFKNAQCEYQNYCQHTLPQFIENKKIKNLSLE